MSNVLPFSNPPDGEAPNSDGQFYKAFNGMDDAMNVLHCAYRMMQTIDVIECHDEASIAVSVVGKALRSMRQSRDELDQWFVNSTHAPKPVDRVEA